MFCAELWGTSVMLTNCLFQDAELRLVRFLPDILVLQRDLVKKFQNVTDLTYSTIGEFLHSQKAGTGHIRNLTEDLPWLSVALVWGH